MENEVTTLFFGGVNADQCVVCSSMVSNIDAIFTHLLQWSTFIDAYFKGYDVVYVEDISATTSPYYATQMLVYNADGEFIIYVLAGSC